jgi:sulfoxide reductase heme-binding subunit YedZ
VSPPAQRPLDYGWWLASRAAGLVGFTLLALTVCVGLLMANKQLRRPSWMRALVAVHEQLALASLVAIAVHGLTLLGDSWLRPGLAGIALPFAMRYRPAFTGLGIIAGYAAALLGLSFYVRRLLGARLWRQLHRLTSLVYLLAVVHALGGGTDRHELWLRAGLLATALPVGGLLAARMVATRRSHTRLAAGTARD